MSAPKRIRDLPHDSSLANVRFIYPGDGQPYYWRSQWACGVFGSKKFDDPRIYPLFVKDFAECLDWELAPEGK